MAARHHDLAPFTTVPFEGVYLVTDELDRATHAEVDDLERTLGFRMPAGYREYITTLGEGDYCDILRVHPPKRILAELGSMRPFTSRFGYRWHRSEVTEIDVAGSVRFAATSNADVYAAHQCSPDRIICVPNDGGNPIVAVNAAQIRLEDLYWQTFDLRPENRPRLRVFESWINRQYFEGSAGTTVMHPETVVRFLEHRYRWSERAREDTIAPEWAVTVLYLKGIQGYAEVQWQPDPVQPKVQRVGFTCSTAHVAAAADFGRWLEGLRFTWR